METLQALVKFIYTDSLDCEKDDIKALYSAADKYDIQVCQNFLVKNEYLSSKGLGFFTSEAPPLSQLNSWNVASEQNAVRQQRMGNKIREGGVCYLAVSQQKKEGEMMSLFWCTQSNPNICTDPLIKTTYSNCIISVSLF